MKKLFLFLMLFVLLSMSGIAQYYPSSYTVVGGVELQGNLTCLQDLSSPCLEIQPSSSVPAFDVRFNYSNITDVSSATLSYYHGGISGSGLADFEIYDYDYNAWLDLDQFALAESLETVNHPIEDSSRFISNGTVQIRFWLDQTGNPSHRIYINGQRLEESIDELVSEYCPTTELQLKEEWTFLIIFFIFIFIGYVTKKYLIGFFGSLGLFVEAFSFMSCDLIMFLIISSTSLLLMFYFLLKDPDSM